MQVDQSVSKVTENVKYFCICERDWTFSMNIGLKNRF